MKNLTILMFVLLAFASSCIENPKPVIEKPLYKIKGSYETVVTLKGSDPPKVFLEINGTGEASHIGKSTFKALSTQLVIPPPPFALSGTSTMIAANGDEIYTEYEGQVMPLESGLRLVTVNHTIIGGTGRFKNGKGYYKETGEADVNTGLGYINIEGEISY
jgi:hypothetical protein